MYLDESCTKEVTEDSALAEVMKDVYVVLECEQILVWLCDIVYRFESARYSDVCVLKQGLQGRNTIQTT